VFIGSSAKKGGLHVRIISASIVLLSGSSLAILINLAYNVGVAHFLGPKGFGNANALFTLLTLVSAVTLAFQIATSKVVAQQSEVSGRDAAYRDLHRAAWAVGIAVASLLILFQTQITAYLDLPTGPLVAIIAVGTAFYVPLGSRRGYIQGAHGFRKLATNLVLEGGSRLVGSLLMIAFGFDVMGVVIANAAAIAIAYFAIAPRLDLTGSNPMSFDKSFSEISQATVFFAGQVLINNCDIVLVKHYFPMKEAGLYAAIALVGRVTFASSSAVVNGMFPVVAGAKREERKSLSLIGTALSLVVAVGGTLVIGLRFTPAWLWTHLFGSSFQIAGPYDFPFLLTLYAATTVVYCLAVVVMTYEMSYKIANANWYQLLFSGVLIAGICRYHDSLLQVIVVQLVLLTAFLVVISLQFLWSSRDSSPDKTKSFRVIRPISEDAVISEFLKSDFENAAYSEFHGSLRNIVFDPDLNQVLECSARRALLDQRHRALWTELPRDTQWFEVEILKSNLDKIKVFPRAQWTRISRGNFAITKVAERIKRVQRGVEDPSLEKISDIREFLSVATLDTGSVILIGQNDLDYLTVLDGNHRFIAAILEGKIDRLRFVCGLSNKMTQCCWYRTNFFNLVRYGRNLLRHSLKNPNRELLDLCDQVSTLSNK